MKVQNALPTKLIFLLGGGGVVEKVMDFYLSLRGPFTMCISPFEEEIATGQTAQDLYTILFFFFIQGMKHIS